MTICTDVTRFLRSEKQQERIDGFLKESRDGIFSSMMPYRKNDDYTCRGLFCSAAHEWEDGADDLDRILIRFKKENGELKLMSIYPVPSKQLWAEENENREKTRKGEGE